MESNAIDLLPCPFCGHTASLEVDDDNRWQQVLCGGCGAKGPERMQRGAAEAWNNRDLRYFGGKLPRSFVQQGKELAEGAHFMGHPLDALSRDELIAIAVQGWKAVETTREDEARARDLLGGGLRSKWAKKLVEGPPG